MELPILAAFVIGAFFLIQKVMSAGGSSGRSNRNTYVIERTRAPAPDDFESEPFRIKNSVLEQNQAWLESRWREAAAAKEAGDASAFPHWYFDEVTERQLERIRKMGIVLRGRTLTKGQASDVIGLGVQPDAQDSEVLKFFKVPLRDMNQTRAKVEAARLLADPENAEKWSNRGASAGQREYIRFFGEKVPKGAKHDEAAALISELEERYPEKAEEWDNLQCILMDFDDRDARDAMEIKKPSAKQLRECIDLLVSEGQTLEQLDSDIVAARLIELHPELEKPWDY